MSLRSLGLCGVAALTLQVAPLTAQSTYSVRDVLSYSFASGLVAAPVGDRIAWIENHEPGPVPGADLAPIGSPPGA